MTARNNVNLSIPGEMKEKQNATNRQQGLFCLCVASPKQKEIVYGG